MARISDEMARKPAGDALRRVEPNNSELVKNKLRDLIDAPIDTHLERIGAIMDRAIKIPGTSIRIGLDPIIGFFFPVIGDWVGGIVSAYIVLASIRHGLPKSAIAKMVFNVGVDVLLGSIPFLGDIFDFAWKPNDKNLRLLNKYATGKRKSLWSDWAWVLALLGLVVVFVIVMIGVAIYLLRSAGYGLI